jgi:CRP-like cAMP-binding protein
VDASRLSAFEVLAGLPATELAEIAAVMTEAEHDAGTTIISRGDYGYVLYFIEEGEANVVADGGEVTATLGVGDTFGEIALLVTGRRTADVVARTQLRLLSLFDQDFQRIRARLPELDRTLRRLSGERMTS